MTPDGYVIPHPADEASANARAQDALMDEASFQSFYRRHGRALWSYLCRMVGNHAHADDLLQEAFCKFLVAPVGALDESAQRAYLFRIATNLVIDQWRKRTREQQALDQFAPSLPSASAGLGPSATGPSGMGASGTTAAGGAPGFALGQGLSIDMARTFAELKPRERALLWLAYVEGSEHDEIAQSLGLKPKSIRVLLFRARHRLAALLKKKGLGAGKS
jgi:RNA polymerase sigma-70 factor, ECF subfamily